MTMDEYTQLLLLLLYYSDHAYLNKNVMKNKKYNTRYGHTTTTSTVPEYTTLHANTMTQYCTRVHHNTCSKVLPS